MARAWTVITAQVFSMTFGFVPRAFPDDLYEGSVKFSGRPHRWTWPYLSQAHLLRAHVHKKVVKTSSTGRTVGVDRRAAVVMMVAVGRRGLGGSVAAGCPAHHREHLAPTGAEETPSQQCSQDQEGDVEPGGEVPKG